MAFAPKSGCPMCSIVATALHAPSHSPRTPSFPTGSKQPEVLWRDDNFTIYRERAYPVSSKGHLIVVFNLHVPSLYTLSSSDVPLLVKLRELSQRLLSSLLAPDESEGSPAFGSQSPATPNTATPTTFLQQPDPESQQATPSASELFRIGFITPPFKDSKIPVTDHLHAHAYILPADLMGWWRSVGYSNLAWYDIDDLIAEIREESSNNRIRSGPSSRSHPRPIDTVPAAGARTGTADGLETTDSGLAVEDVEDPDLLHPRRLSRIDSTSSSGSATEQTGLTVDVARSVGSGVPFTGAGGALLLSPKTVSDEGMRTPSGASPSSNSQIPHLRV
ncbi:hypothetical protein ABKN59_001036 [Abortiporus biennis]